MLSSPRSKALCLSCYPGGVGGSSIQHRASSILWAGGTEKEINEFCVLHSEESERCPNRDPSRCF